MSSVRRCEPRVETATCRSLAQLEKGQSARILDIRAHAAEVPDDLIRRLLDLGFLPGEHVRVLALGPLSREPIAVRIGTATYALRRQEADCILIAPLE